MKAKGLRVGSDSYNENKLAKTPANAMTQNQRFHAEMTEYKQAREKGLQPAGTKLEQIRAATRVSENSGEAYRADR